MVLRPVLRWVNSTVASGSCVKLNAMGIWKMNERIKELKKQAWEYAMAVHDGHIVPPLDKEVWPIDKVLDEKFAELIVGECMTIAKNWEDELENADSVSESNAVGIVAYRIARQFGVKE